MTLQKWFGGRLNLIFAWHSLKKFSKIFLCMAQKVVSGSEDRLQCSFRANLLVVVLQLEVERGRIVEFLQLVH